MIRHASAVAVGDKGLLIQGASGRGKSALGLQLMALGADLGSDDRVEVTRQDDAIVLSPPARIAGLIEARGIGILRANWRGGVPLALIVDLDHVETKRLPELRTTEILGRQIPILGGNAHSSFPSALLQYLKAGLAEV